MDLVKKVLKNALLFAAVGVALSLVLAPALTACGVPAGIISTIMSTTTPITQGVFFGIMGGLTAFCGPIIDKIFGDKTPSETPQRRKNDISEAIVREQETTVSIGQERNFRDRFADTRSGGESFQERLAAAASRIENQQISV